jgi:hypothetical protein
VNASVSDDAANTVISPVGFFAVGAVADALGPTNAAVASRAARIGTMARILPRTTTSGWGLIWSL